MSFYGSKESGNFGLFTYRHGHPVVGLPGRGQVHRDYQEPANHNLNETELTNESIDKEHKPDDNPPPSTYRKGNISGSSRFTVKITIRWSWIKQCA